MVVADVHQRHLQHREDRVGEQDAENPEQGAHQQLHGEHDCRREVDRSPGDVRNDQIAVDVLHEEIDEDCEEPSLGPALNPTATISTPEMIAPTLGMKASMPVIRPSSAAIGIGRPEQLRDVGKHEPGEEAFEHHAQQAAEKQAAEREADMVGDPVEALAVPKRQHPGDSAVVDARLDRRGKCRSPASGSRW